MKSKMIWANLGVEDVQRTKEFYTKLGFKPNGPNNTTDELTSFLFSDNNFVIHFFRHDKLQESVNVPFSNIKYGSEIMFSFSADTEEAIHYWAKKVEEAGGTIIMKPGRYKGGYFYFVFADPDAHKFNVLLIEKGM